MRLASILLSLAVAVAALVLPAVGSLNYHKGLTTVADLESLRLLDDEGRFRKHTLVAFTLPDDCSSACALEQLEALRFPHLFFHLPGTIFEMIQVFVDPDTELTQALLPKASHKDACRSFLFIPQNTTVAAAEEGADAEGRRLLAQSQRELEGWFWGLQCAGTGQAKILNDLNISISIYREGRRPRLIEMQDNNGRKASGGQQPQPPEVEVPLATLAPGDTLASLPVDPICRGHTLVLREPEGFLVARLIMTDEDKAGPIAITGLLALPALGPPSWDPRRLQLNEELVDKYRLRRTFTIERLERVEWRPRRLPSFTTLGFDKYPVPAASWAVLKLAYDSSLSHAEAHALEAASEHLFYGSIESEAAPLPGLAEQRRTLGQQELSPAPITTIITKLTKQGSECHALERELLPLLRRWSERDDLVTLMCNSVRRYHNGSILRDHVDMGERHLGVIINMGQDIDESWPLHAIDHSGRRHRVTLLPGEMIFYEQGRVSHSRPIPLRGRYVDNCFFQVKVKGMETRPITDAEAGANVVAVSELPAHGVAAAAPEVPEAADDATLEL